MQTYSKHHRCMIFNKTTDLCNKFLPFTYRARLWQWEPQKKDAADGRGLRILEMSMTRLLCRQESRAGEGGRPKVRDGDASLTEVGRTHTLRRQQAPLRVADGRSVGGRRLRKHTKSWIHRTIALHHDFNGCTRVFFQRE